MVVISKWGQVKIYGLPLVGMQNRIRKLAERSEAKKNCVRLFDTMPRIPCSLNCLPLLPAPWSFWPHAPCSMYFLTYSSRSLKPIAESQFCDPTQKKDSLRIPDRYDAVIAEIFNFWTFWLINNLFKSPQKGFMSDFEKMVY